MSKENIFSKENLFRFFFVASLAGASVGCRQPEVSQSVPRSVLPTAQLTQSEELTPEQQQITKSEELTPEQQEIFLSHKRDAQNIIAKWINSYRRINLKLLPDTNVGTNNTNFTSWVLEQPTTVNGDQYQQFVTINEGYDDTTHDLSYFKMSGTSTDLSQAQHPPLVGQDGFAITEETVRKFLVIPEGLAWNHMIKEINVPQVPFKVKNYIVSARGTYQNREISLDADSSNGFSLQVHY